MIKKLIQRWANRRSYRMAKAEAIRRRAKDFKKYYVVFINGEFHCISGQHLKNMHKNNAFKKGVNLRKIKSFAVFQTH